MHCRIQRKVLKVGVLDKQLESSPKKNTHEKVKLKKKKKKAQQ